MARAGRLRRPAQRNSLENLEMNGVEEALLLFEQGANCSQAVLAAYGPRFGLERNLCLKIAGPFGGGVARSGEICGAVSGALMALGLRFGSGEIDAEEKEKLYGLAQKLLQEFKAQHGSITCRGLLGCDLGTPEGRQTARERDFHHTLCPKFVRSAAEILEGIPAGQ